MSGLVRKPSRPWQYEWLPEADPNRQALIGAANVRRGDRLRQLAGRKHCSPQRRDKLLRKLRSMGQ